VTANGPLREPRQGAEREYGPVELRVTSDAKTGGFEIDIELPSLDGSIAHDLVANRGVVTDAVGAKHSVAFRFRRAAAGTPTRLGVELASPQIEARALQIGWDDRHIFLSQPAHIVWRPTARIAGRILMGKENALSGSPVITFDVAEARIARAIEGNAATGPFLPGVFAIDATVASSQAVFEAVPGAAIPTGDLSLHLESDDSGRDLRFELHGKAVGGAAEDSHLRGKLNGLFGAQGFAELGNVTFDGEGKILRLSTAVIDNLLGLDGLAAQLIGPHVQGRFRASDLSRRRGSFELTAEGSRARVRARAAVREGVIEAIEPAHLTLMEIDSQLVDRLVVGLPFVSSFEKQRVDGPGRVVFESFRVPLDGDRRKLDGVTRADLGVVRFETEALLGRVLKLTGATGKQLKRKFKPFVVTAKRGVLTYDKYYLPIGGEEIATAGKVDLVENSIDMVLYVPILMLAERMVGNVRTGLSSLIPGSAPVLGSLTRMPIRVRGPLDDPEVAADLELFAEDNAEELERAGGILRELPGKLPILRRER
jgi:hypothetical protein